MTGVRWALCGVVASLMTGCVVPGELLDEKPCPCAPGYRCVDGVRCEEGAAQDAGTPDAGVGDAGTDAATPDAGTPDAGSPDAGVLDAGLPDAGVPDAGVPDARPPDAGPPGPIALYSCESLDDGFLRDASGNTRDGRCDAAGCPDIVAGRVGNACDFTSEARRLRVSYDPALVPRSDAGFSVALWVWFHDPAPGAYRRASAIGQAAGSGLANVWQVFFAQLTESPEFVFVTTDATEVRSLRTERALAFDTWIHLAVVFDRGLKVTYIDGLEATRSAGETIEGSNQDVLIGADENDGSVLVFPLDGMLDEIHIYDRALSPAEVLELATVP
ncbi:MAG: LamG-like jellyroll fold domain-containing protein [Sandaracinaceae bacterium]